MPSIEEKVVLILREVNPAVSFEPAGDRERKLTDLGFDSLDLASIFLQVEEVFDIKIEDSEIDQVNSIASLAKKIAG
jgi:acyl carrier protein